MKNEAKTIAEQISSRFNDDGQCWKDNHDFCIWDICEDEAKIVNTDNEHSAKRYIFEDDSDIVIVGSGWDFQSSWEENDAEFNF